MTDAPHFPAPLPVIPNRLAGLFEAQRRKTARTLLVVGRPAQQLSVLITQLKEFGYRIAEAESAPVALRKLESCSVDAVVADYQAPPIGADELCRELKSRQVTLSLPILIVASPEDLDAEIASIEAGADAFFAAPVRTDVLHARIKACLRRKDVLDSMDLPDSLFFAVARAVEARDSLLGSHCERLAHMSAIMGLRLGLPTNDIITLQRGGYIHDIGKIALPDSVLLKAAPLEPHEWEIMKTHPARGEAICARARSLRAVLPLIRHHHERWDGSGYPDGLKGNQIPLLARILQLADVYDALTAERPYKRAFSPEEAIAILREETRKGWRDPDLLPIFEQAVPLFRSESFFDLAPLSLTSLATSLAG